LFFYVQFAGQYGESWRATMTNHVPTGLQPLGAGNSGPGGAFDRGPAWPLIVELAEVFVRLVVLRSKTAVERRVEVVHRRTGEPIISLTQDEARGLGYLLRRKGQE
jgi:hypothetical protein